MPQPTTPSMLSQVVQSLARLLPRSAPPHEAIDWADSERGWHNSSYALAHGLEVIEHFESSSLFPDTLPAFHLPPTTPASVA
jgi:hypothetical protein